VRIRKIKIENFKCFGKMFEVEFNDGVNIIVGANEAGKSTILEAIHLALTGMLHGRPVRNDLSSYLFNREIEMNYLASIASGSPMPPPSIIIEVYLSGECSKFADLEGNGNTDHATASGVAYRIELDEANYGDSYAELIASGDVKSIPVEYYTANMVSFARKGITSRNVPIKPALIDSASSRFQNGSDVYISRIVRDHLDDNERVQISQAHRQLRESFRENTKVKAINTKITNAAKISNKTVSISADMSSQNAWENSLITYVDDIPFHHIGKGEQCLIKTKLALSTRKSSEATVLLIEEPENHLSHVRLNQLVQDLSDGNSAKQIIISTHSSFVANKLGLENLVLIRNSNVVRIDQLEASDFFKKLAGYDTLRLVLAERVILVEGDSDELIIQRAYMDKNDGRLPISCGIDVISVGLTFLRFLELAKVLKIPVAVVTDNDGDVDALIKKYADYASNEKIKICYESEVHTGNLEIGVKPFNYNTLEPSLFRVNTREDLAKIFGNNVTTDDDLHRYMKANKTDCALKIFGSITSITYPEYILKAIEE
jgi:putative ATP-dependent endonuclease of the OLD family